VADRVDTGALPLTQPHPSPIFDTGPHPDPLGLAGIALVDPPQLGTPPPPVEFSRDDYPAYAAAPISGPVHIPAQPIAVPAQLVSLKRWKLVVVLLGIWVSAAAIGLAMYYRWFHAVDKTWPDFVVLVYVVACMVAGLIVSMSAEARPTRAAVAIGVMSAPFISGCAAAVLLGMYVFGWITP